MILMHLILGTGITSEEERQQLLVAAKERAEIVKKYDKVCDILFVHGDCQLYFLCVNSMIRGRISCLPVAL